MTISKLLKKYDSYVPGEYEPVNRERERKKRSRINDRLQTLQQLLTEAPRLTLNRYEYERVQYFLENIDNLKQLHRKSKLETIILAIVFYVKLTQNSYIQVEEWSICKKYGLTNRTYSLIITHLLETVLKKSPLPIKPTTKYDHNILEKEAF